jgi:DNA-binding NarL/FixJ family response regulator
MLKIVVVDDDVAFRRAVEGLLREHFPTVEFGEADNGREALKQIEGTDLMFVDISLPDENGLDLTARIKSEHPGFVVSILTIHDSPEYREAAFQHGADYFVSKGAPAEKIIEVVRSTLARTHRNNLTRVANITQQDLRPLLAGALPHFRLITQNSCHKTAL